MEEFAGVERLFIAYSPVGSALTLPQLPGLLAPVQCLSEGVASAGRAGSTGGAGHGPLAG